MFAGHDRVAAVASKIAAISRNVSIVDGREDELAGFERGVDIEVWVPGSLRIEDVRLRIVVDHVHASVAASQSVCDEQEYGLELIGL